MAVATEVEARVVDLGKAVRVARVVALEADTAAVPVVDKADLVEVTREDRVDSAEVTKEVKAVSVEDTKGDKAVLEEDTKVVLEEARVEDREEVSEVGMALIVVATRSMVTECRYKCK